MPCKGGRPTTLIKLRANGRRTGISGTPLQPVHWRRCSSPDVRIRATPKSRASFRRTVRAKACPFVASEKPLGGEYWQFSGSTAIARRGRANVRTRAEPFARLRRIRAYGGEGCPFRTACPCSLIKRKQQSPTHQSRLGAMSDRSLLRSRRREHALHGPMCCAESASALRPSSPLTEPHGYR
jgi:hypothetical protein